MSTRRQRLLMVLLCLGGLALSAWFVLSAFKKNLVFFLTPSQVHAGDAPLTSAFRLGGLVEPKSLLRPGNGLTITFLVTDQLQRVKVQYKGLLPDLFKEGKGVVAQGRLGPGGIFLADEVLAKHDENYMPPQVSKSLAHQQRDQALAAQASTSAHVNTKEPMP